jgi:hypothetical protein
MVNLCPMKRKWLTARYMAFQHLVDGTVVKLSFAEKIYTAVSAITELLTHTAM